MNNTVIRRHPYWLVALLVFLVGALYWSIWASDRYVSKANVVLQSASLPLPSLNVSTLLKGGGSHDLLLLREYLLSVDMLKALDEELDLRGHYSDPSIDWFSRLAGDAPLERFHLYYQKRVVVELDEYAQVLRIEAHAYDPEMAQRIASLLLQAGEQHMNAMGQRLADEQVRFIEHQVTDLGARLEHARDALIAYQNEHGLISPTGAVESISAVVSKLEVELASLNARRRAVGASQSASSAEMIAIGNQINAVQRQIQIEQSRMAARSGGALNQVSAEYEKLRLNTEFALEMYSNALAALESTRVEAARTLKQVSILQSPTRPEYATAPRRLHNVAVLGILALLLGLVSHLLVAIIRDHMD